MVALLKKTGHTRLRVPPFFPALLLQKLQQSGIRVEISEEPVYPQRAVKKAEEVARIREVQRAAVAATRAAMAEIRQARVDRRGFLVRHGKKLTAEDVKVVIELELMRRQCQGRDTIVAGMISTPRTRTIEVPGRCAPGRPSCSIFFRSIKSTATGATSRAPWSRARPSRSCIASTRPC